MGILVWDLESLEPRPANKKLYHKGVVVGTSLGTTRPNIGPTRTHTSPEGGGGPSPRKSSSRNAFPDLD